MNKLWHSKNLRDFAKITLGCVLFALAFDLFLQPSQINPGGISGLAMVGNHLFGMPVGVLIVLMNIPLVIAAFFHLGRRLIFATAYATALSSLLIDLGSQPTWFYDDILLSSLYGGVLLGAGMGLVFSGGATTGGSDLVSRLLTLRYPGIRLGRIILLVDISIISLSAVVFQDINKALYAAITLYISTLMIDAILYGFDRATLVYVVSCEALQIGDALQQQLGRGVTYLQGKGGFRGDPKQVVMCAIKRNQSTELYELVKNIDPKAFVIALEAYQIFGEGFSPHRCPKEL